MGYVIAILLTLSVCGVCHVIRTKEMRRSIKALMDDNEMMRAMEKVRTI